MSVMFCMWSAENLDAAEKWTPLPDDPKWEAHIIDGVQVGARNKETGEYWAYDPPSDSWSRSRTSPRMLANPGLVRGKLSDRERWTVDGYLSSAVEAKAMLTSNPSLADDRDAISLTVIGDPQDRERVARDLVEAPELQRLRGYYVLQTYSPTDPMIRNAGFVVTGRPTIYLQTPDGAVLARSDRYEGPGVLAGALTKAVKLWQGLRRRRPDYRPDSDTTLADLFNPRRAIYRAIGAVIRDVAILMLVAGLAWIGVRYVRARIVESTPATKTRNAATRRK